MTAIVKACVIIVVALLVLVWYVCDQQEKDRS